jgi:hypothetical protein
MDHEITLWAGSLRPTPRIPVYDQVFYYDCKTLTL